MEQKKAMIGMSGGVDSSVAALLMQEKGYSCIGVTMKLHNILKQSDADSKTCCSTDDVEDAKNVARKLGIPHYVFNMQDAFDTYVMSKFASVYENGATPNPCIDCNRYLKFGKLLEKAQELGCDYVVSGHYARVIQDPSTGRFLLKKAADVSKDQTYFLYCLSQEQLKHIQFPLGALTKVQVREIAARSGFLNARKHDSQDICFVPDGDYAAFLKEYTGKSFPVGNFLDTEGRIVGQHNGAVRYTIGQRKGLGIALGKPVYVCHKNMADNTVTLGNNEDLFSPALRASDWFWFPFETLMQPMRVTAKIRHSQIEHPATVYPEENGFARVEFDVPQRAVSPGQAVVLYQDDFVLGGGTITEALK